MGLADEKLKLSFKSTAERFEKNFASKDFPLKFEVQWDTFTGLTSNMVSLAESVASTFATALNDYHMNKNIEHYKMAWDAVNSSFNTIVMVHAKDLKKLDYKLEIKDKKLFFTANFTEFVFSPSRDGQKTLKESLEAIL